MTISSYDACFTPLIAWQPMISEAIDDNSPTEALRTGLVFGRLCELTQGLLRLAFYDIVAMKSSQKVAGRHMGWKNIIGEANKLLFVGRVQEIHLFRQHITCIPPNCLIFYITGKAWVGKTTLLNYYQTIALENRFILAESDERHKDILTILGHFAMQLRDQKHPPKNFESRYKTYRQKMHEIENDPEAPRGWTDLIGRWGVRVAYTLGHSIATTQNGLSYFPPQEALETQVSEWGEYLANKFRNRDDLSLMREPETVLTQLFFRDLNSIARKQKILLCFENFEQTRPALQEWFLHLHEYDPSPNIRIAIAGRTPPGSQWEPLRPVTTTIALDVFSQQEAELFLDNRQITDQHDPHQIRASPYDYEFACCSRRA